ncbi:hypothetical protein [Stappia sp.]|uniref:hypothetical protein n=1 Tax=Stappia sp. TaxID=1870903 RepID=UPI003D1529CB
MRIEQGYRPARGPGETRRNARTETGAAAQADASLTREIVAVDPVAAVRTDRFYGFHRPNAGFIAQLIATREQLPQTRARRRAAPAEAIDAYRTAERQPRILPAGRILAVSR